MNEDNMRVYEFDSIYDDETGKLNVTDASAISFLNSTNPLYIGARQGQVTRMKELIESSKLGGCSVGYWNLTGNPGYITKKATLNLEKLREHDVIIFAHRGRVHEDFREAYGVLIDAVRKEI